MVRSDFLYDKLYNELSCTEFNIRNRIQHLKSNLLQASHEPDRLQISDAINELEQSHMEAVEKLQARENDLLKIRAIERGNKLRTRESKARY